MCYPPGRSGLLLPGDNAGRRPRCHPAHIGGGVFLEFTWEALGGFGGTNCRGSGIRGGWSGSGPNASSTRLRFGGAALAKRLSPVMLAAAMLNGRFRC